MKASFRLTKDFNSKDSKFSTPITKVSTSFQTTPRSPYPSPNKKVRRADEIVCEKEENFLEDLREFHAEVSKYEELKEQLTASSRKLAKDSISLLSLASNLSAYQQKLEQRANFAHQILSDPIDQLDTEERLVKHLEDDLALFRQKVPNPPTPEEIQEIDEKLRQAEQIQNTNAIRSQQLEKKRRFFH